MPLMFVHDDVTQQIQFNPRSLPWCFRCASGVRTSEVSRKQLQLSSVSNLAALMKFILINWIIRHNGDIKIHV